MSDTNNGLSLKIGLTGGIASGKSSAAEAFRKLGITVIDADQVARQVVEVGQPALKKIESRFGKQVIAGGGSLDRPALRNIVFADKQALADLESITHPAIAEEVESQAFSASGDYVVIELPLLVEKQNYAWLDRVLVVDATVEQQLSRLAARSGITGDQAQSILAAQASREQRLAKADDVIENHGDLAEIEKQVKQLHNKYLALANKQFRL